MATETIKAAVIGGSGYGGGEIIRRLIMHPHVSLERVASIDFVDEPVWSAHPNLTNLTDLVFRDISATEAAEGMDVVLLGLPHTIASKKVSELVAADVRIIDLSGDFRLRDLPTYERYYKTQHPCPELIEGFVYGLPELNRDRIRQARHIASPGCFATTIELALLPLATRGWLHGAIEAVAATGSSGSGVRAMAGTHHPVRAMNFKAYKTLTHQHTPEIVQTLHDAGGIDIELNFVPMSAPMSRGLFATCFAHVDASVDPDEIRDAFAQSYKEEPFVRVPEGRLPEVAAVSGSNYVEVGCVVGPVSGSTRLVTCFAALDNLIKGGAGQAIQSLNISSGFDEKTSLVDAGSWP